MGEPHLWRGVKEHRPCPPSDIERVFPVYSCPNGLGRSTLTRHKGPGCPVCGVEMEGEAIIAHGIRDIREVEIDRPQGHAL